MSRGKRKQKLETKRLIAFTNYINLHVRRKKCMEERKIVRVTELVGFE